MFKVGDKIRYKHSVLKEWRVPIGNPWYTNVLTIIHCDEKNIRWRVNDIFGDNNVLLFELVKPKGPLTEIETLDQIRLNILEDL